MVAPEQDPTESTVDFIYGSNTSIFSGVHRFSVSRSPDRPGAVRISLQSAVCNPSGGQALWSWLFGFHSLYSAMLFRESAGEVQRRLLSDG